MTSHLTIPRSLEWDSPEVERLAIATLRYAGGKEHNVRYVSEVHYDAALAREAALLVKLGEWLAHSVKVSGENTALQKRLTVAEQRLSQVEGACDLAMSAIDDDERGANFVKIIQAIKVKAALKPAEENSADQNKADFTRLNSAPHCPECGHKDCNGQCYGDDMMGSEG